MNDMELLGEYRKTLGAQRLREEDLPIGALDYHLPFLDRLDAVEESSVALYDTFLGGYRFLENRLRFVDGDAEEARRRGPEYFFERMHPDDLPRFLERSIRLWRFLLHQPPSARKEYKLVLDYRIDRGGGSYLRMVQQAVVLELDRRGNVWLVLVINDPLRKGDVSQSSRASIVHLPTGRRVTVGGNRNPESLEDEEQPLPLSPREVEILELLADGLASKEIAWRLEISVNTVNNHRQRILRKTGARNSTEAVSYASGLGLI